VQQGVGEVIEGALAAVTPVALAPGPIVVLPPRIDLLALAPGTLEGPIFPSQRMDVGLTLVDVEEFVTYEIPAWMSLSCGKSGSETERRFSPIAHVFASLQTAIN
jgi:hypothetical protein